MRIQILLLLIFVASTNSWGRQKINSNRYQLLSGRRNAVGVKGQWDKKYSRSEYVYGKSPAKFLANNFHFIPEKSTVLDMGMGEGRNAVFLATKGYKVTGVDISSVAVRKSRVLAKEFDVRIKGIVASLTEYKIKEKSLDSIICFYFVERSLNKKIMRWLKPGGILIYEAHTLNQKKVKGSEHYNIKYLLRPGELLRLFPKMRVLKYEEALHKGEFIASIILQKISN